MAERYREHRLIIQIEGRDAEFSASIVEPNSGNPHWVMSGPPRDYAGAVDELIEALRRHLLADAH